MTPDWILIAARLIHFAAVLVLFGGAIFRLYASTAFRGIEGARCIFDRWLWRTLTVAALISFLSSIAWFLAQSAIMGDGWANGSNPTTLSTVLFETQFGRLWGGRIIIVLLAILVLGLCRRRYTPTLMLGVTVLSLILVASLAGVGHAMMDEGVSRATAVFIQAIHLLAASIWIGGLMPLGYLLHHASRRSDPLWRKAALIALPRYSLVGMGAVSLLLLSGIVRSWSLVGGFAALFQTAYGQLLLAKIGVFLIMVGIAVFNRLVLMEAIAKGAARDTQRTAPIIQLWRNVVIELALAIVTIAIVSMLGIMSPRDHGGDGESATVTSQP